MTSTVPLSETLASRLVTGILSVKPLANFAKQQARQMMIKRAEKIGVYWRQEVQNLRSRGEAVDFSPDWEQELAAVKNPHLTYPDYYPVSFHAYDEGNLGWAPATELEVAAQAVHATIWPEKKAAGDAHLRQTYHQLLQAQLPTPPQTIVDLGCGVGLSTFTLQAVYPHAQVTGVDLSPYFLAIARYRAQQQQASLTWLHAPAEATGLLDASCDLVSACLMFHELPQTAALQILQEARRLLCPGGHLAIMDMNPRSQVLAKMPPYVLTLLKSTEPYLDQYLSLDLEEAIVAAGFQPPTVTCNSPRHRTLIAQV